MKMNSMIVLWQFSPFCESSAWTRRQEVSIRGQWERWSRGKHAHECPEPEMEKRLKEDFDLFRFFYQPQPWWPWSRPRGSHQTDPQCTQGSGSSSSCCRQRLHSRGCRSQSRQAWPHSPPTRSGGSPPDGWDFTAIQLINFINFIIVAFTSAKPARSVCPPSPPLPLLCHRCRPRTLSSPVHIVKWSNVWIGQLRQCQRQRQKSMEKIFTRVDFPSPDSPTTIRLNSKPFFTAFL